VLSFLCGGVFGFLHGARICEAEGLRVKEDVSSEEMPKRMEVMFTANK
jgi:hypothetical protein